MLLSSRVKIDNNNLIILKIKRFLKVEEMYLFLDITKHTDALKHHIVYHSYVQFYVLCTIKNELKF